MTSFVFSLFSGAVGMAYLVYGMRQKKLMPVIAGVLLGIYPFFLESWLWLGVIGVVLLAAPFVIDF